MTKTYMGLTVSLFALAGAAGLSQPAQAADLDRGIYDCRKGVELKVSGQINRGILFADDGTNDDIFFVDNDNSSSRIRLTSQGNINCEWTVGTNFEVEWESNTSADIKIDQNSSAKSDRFKERKIEVWFKGPLGKISLGQGDTASNGTSEVDLSKTGVVAYSGIEDLAGGILFVGTTVAIKNAYSQMDGLSRRDRVRYDTPTVAGFTLSTSYSDRDHADVALRFSQDFGGTKVAAAAAYSNVGNRSDIAMDYQINGSLSILFPIGLNLTVAAGKQSDVGVTMTNPHFYYAKAGWIFNATSLGPVAIAVDYGMSEDLVLKGDEFTSYGAAIVQHIPHVGTEIYAAVRNHSLKRTGIANPDDIIAVTTGARVKF